MALKTLLDVKADKAELVRTAYMACDLRFQAIDLLVGRYGMDATISLVLELGGTLLTRADVDRRKSYNLIPVFERTLGKDWKEIFDAVGTKAFRLVPWKVWLDAEEDVRLFLRSGHKTKREKQRAAKVKDIVRKVGIE